MSAIYSPYCACELIAQGCAVAGLVREDLPSERAACLAWLAGVERFDASFMTAMPVSARYFAVHGPGGHVIGVRP